MSERDELWDSLGIDPDRISREEFEQHMNAYEHALAEKIRAYADKTEILGPVERHESDGAREAADLIDPPAGPVRPGEEKNA
jgi:hypothetical protein